MDPILYNATMEGNTGDGDFLLADYLNRDEENGYQVTPKDNSVLHVAALYGQSGFVRQVIDIIPALLCCKNKKNETALHLAAHKGHKDVVKVLLLGPDVAGQAVGINKETLMRMTDDGGDTALHKAVRPGCVDTVRLLVEQDPDFEFPANNAGETLLYLAAESGLVDCLSVILEHCNRPTYSGPCGRTALHAAIIQEHLATDVGVMENDTDSQMHDAGMTMMATSIATTSRTNAPQAMALTEKPEKFTSIDFKRCRTKTAKELWGALERKYKTEDAETKKFFVVRFLEYKMIDNQSVVFQVQELQVIIHDLLAEVAPVCIHCESQVAIGRAGNMMYNGKSRHIRWRHNIIKELLSSGIITVDYVKSKDNVLDPLTKGLSREGVERTSKGMGLRPRTSQHGGLRVVVPKMLGWKTSLAYTPAGNGNDLATSIHIAANEGRLNMIRELSFHRPDSLEILNNNGQNALHVTISNYKTRVVRFLLKSKESHSLIDSQIMMAILLSICLLPLTR
ncbi:hypothetical protein T459_11338 [Capsicum annuum]|uniref:Uncharacterized protein n=1 Tax=Capsicum annuum TaxID=4072 RepID=A0A2G2ZLS8_CAPAN|nr:hypothetical protein T459_11338 [Capsicum annuum]